MLTLAIIKRLLGIPVEHESWQLDRAFPEGQIDIDAITDALLYLTDNQIDKLTAERLAIDLGVQVWSWGHRFDEPMLKRTFRWNNIPKLSDTQLKRVFEYLMLLNYAYSIGKYPSEMVRYGDEWLHPKYSGLIKPQYP
jgi:hypothetical protein